MNVSLWFAIILLAVTTFWLLMKLRERVDFLEHEVRWLRQEFEELKPVEVRSQNNPS
jgi:hypothetical protein